MLQSLDSDDSFEALIQEGITNRKISLKDDIAAKTKRCAAADPTESAPNMHSFVRERPTRSLAIQTDSSETDGDECNSENDVTSSSDGEEAFEKFISNMKKSATDGTSSSDDSLADFIVPDDASIISGDTELEDSIFHLRLTNQLAEEQMESSIQHVAKSLGGQSLYGVNDDNELSLEASKQNQGLQISQESLDEFGGSPEKRKWCAPIKPRANDPQQKPKTPNRPVLCDDSSDSDFEEAFKAGLERIRSTPGHQAAETKVAGIHNWTQYRTPALSDATAKTINNQKQVRRSVPYYEHESVTTLSSDSDSDHVIVLPPADTPYTTRHVARATLHTVPQTETTSSLICKYSSSFKSKKDELTNDLKLLYNETVFENKLEGVAVIWNNRLLKTAGLCKYMVTRTSQIRSASVELSVKVCDTAERVRDTLIHELCHAAVWIINEQRDGHGRFWQYWARRAELCHKDLPRITRCHSYDITTKYIYVCNKCQHQVGRHSKSIDLEKKVCGRCHGKFVLLNRGRGGVSTPARTPNKFAMFVKENYGSIKKSNGLSKHADVMKVLGEAFTRKLEL